MNSSSDEETESDQTDYDVPKANPSKGAEKARKGKGAAVYKVVYKAEWGKEFPIKAVPHNKHKFRCIPCGKDISCHHQGLGDVKVHCGREIQDCGSDRRRLHLVNHTKKPLFQKTLSRPK
jgi:hypothetical protein